MDGNGLAFGFDAGTFLMPLCILLSLHESQHAHSQHEDPDQESTIWGHSYDQKFRVMMHMFRQAWHDVQGRQRGDQAEGGAGLGGEGGDRGGP